MAEVRKMEYIHYAGFYLSTVYLNNFLVMFLGYDCNNEYAGTRICVYVFLT